jgi:phage terminase small subunit
MADKLTPKQEAFCLAYVETGNASEAYRRAYSAEQMAPATVNRKAKEVLDNGKITARLAEIRKPAADAAQVTLESHLKRLHDLSLAAEAAGQLSAAISAEVARGKAAGIHIEKSEQMVTTKALPASVDEFI